MGLCVKTDAQMDAVQREKVRGQPEIRAHQFTYDPIIVSSFIKFHSVVTEESSGKLRGGDGGGGDGGGGGGRLKT